MPEILRISKTKAANSQLNVGIRLLFENDDPISIHTIIGSASTLFSNLVEMNNVKESWDRIAMHENKLIEREYFNTMRSAQNFFKHANTDHDAILEFNPVETESLAFMTVMNASSIGELSNEAWVYQLWYLASHFNDNENIKRLLYNAPETFIDLNQKPRQQRLAIGKYVLDEVIKLSKSNRP